MNKQEFLDNLVNGQVAAVQNRAELNKLLESDFEPFDNNLPIVEQNFSADYFHKQCSQLKRSNFAKQRCEHLINVKEKMQEMGVAGFALSEENQKTNKLRQDTGMRLAEFKPQADFQAAIEQRNVDLVRAFISRDLNSEYLDASDVENLVSHTEKMLPETFEPYETDSKFRKPFDENEASWNYDYFINQQSPLNANFALKRVRHLIDVRSKLRQRGVPEFQKLGAELTKEKTVQLDAAKSVQHQAKTHHGQPENQYTDAAHVPHENQHTSLWKAAAIVTGGVLALIALAIAILK